MMRMNLNGAAALMSLLLAGCATAPGPAAAPPTTLPTQWQAALPPADGSAELADWWRRFDDPLLPSLINAAQAASPTLASAAARVAQARATRASAGAALLPALNAVGSASQGRSQLGFPVAANASLGLQASWEIDLFGAVAAGRDAAQARLDGARAAWHDAQIAVAAEVATSYAALRGCEAQLVQTRLDADSRAETARLTELSAKAGFTAPADAALARASAAQARTQAVAQRAACDTQLKSLVELTDIAEPDLRQRLAARTAQVPVAQALAVKVLPAELLAQRPDLAEAARRVVAAAGDQAQASAREKPQLTLSGNIAGAALRSGGETTSGTTWSFGPLQVSFPLFDGGARRAATASAQAAYDEAVAAYRGQVRRAVREVETSLVSLQASAEREADARLAAQDFEASLRATEARQKGGLASLFDLETARRNAVAAQSALIDLQRERTAAWISLYRSLGGGWTDATLAASTNP
jgi:NodT family efflux transporter outer membrane factor (OMF) lipoprotein